MRWPCHYEENLYDKAFVASRTEGFEEYRKIVEGYTPESVEDITGVSASEIRQAARMYAQAKSAAILWGMGVPSSTRAWKPCVL
ncbi:formate dehydrogenase-H subunit alpha [Escherichia coli]|uniref:Formate dehydrogenase-H subunit alpha n=1 Tax=Escherichia coli TaxID=562 RepID=A0A3S4LGI3_ECOLX|nr:formate dehydrogenase-H subunit alpha [Escherichia coli]